MKQLILTFVLLMHLLGAAAGINRVEPAFWWTGMKNPQLQLMVHGENIAAAAVQLTYPGVTLESVTRVANPNYLFLDLKIAKEARPGKFTITFTSGKCFTAFWRAMISLDQSPASDSEYFPVSVRFPRIL